MAVPGLSADVYLDHNMNPERATALRSLGYDFVAAEEIGMAPPTDEVHLVRAACENRVLLTHDLSDFRALAVEWFFAGRRHTGILLAEQPPSMPFRELVRRVAAMLDSRTGEDVANLILWV